MPPSLNSVIARIRCLLVDQQARVWSDETVSEGARLALGEYNLQAGADCTLAGLDGAAETTFPERNETLLVLGGAGYSVLAGQAESLSTTLPEDFGMSAGLLKWAEGSLAEFRGLLADVVEFERLAGLRASSQPWGEWKD